MSASQANRRQGAMTTALRMVLALLLGAGFLACGSKEPALSDQAAADLQAQAARVRAAAAASDRVGASGQLAALRAAVDRYRGQGEISAGRAADVLAAAGEVEARLGLLAPPTPTPPTTTTTARRVPSDPGDDKPGGDKDEEDRGKKGNGKKEGEE